MSTPDDQSIQRLPHLSDTVKPSALCQTTGGWPAIDRGSERRNSSKIGRDAGTGNGVRIVLNRVRTVGTATGVRSYSAMRYAAATCGESPYTIRTLAPLREIDR